MTPEEALLKYWGYNSFKPKQKEIIQSVLDCKDTIALLPTGGGKSICYQVPGVISEGITIVVSPLIALMHDQVEQLNKIGLKAIALTSGIRPNDLDRELENVVQGLYMFLYVSPERIKSELFRERLKRMKVSLIAIDEAHCISQWGHDFRPPYLDIHEIREWTTNVPILALTATANKHVLGDIEKYLKLNAPSLFKNSFLRNNIAINITQSESGIQEIITLLKKKQGSAIVYVRSRRRAQEISETLKHTNISAEYYHAGIERNKRQEKQKAWIENKVRVMVATTAFGMGIDKPDVRLVFHPDLPEDLESYYQEIGRAGRDQKPSEAHLFYFDDQINQLKQRRIDIFPTIKEVKEVYAKLCSFLQVGLGTHAENDLDFNLVDFCNYASIDLFKIMHALKILEQHGLLVYQQNNSKQSQVHITCSSSTLFRFMETYDKYQDLLKLLVRNYGGIMELPIPINETYLSKRLGITKKQLQQFFLALAQQDIIQYNSGIEGETIRIIGNRLDEKSIYLDRGAIAFRLKQLKYKFDSIKTFLTQNTICRNEVLLNYFDESYTKKCMQCDVCNSHNPTDLTDIILSHLSKHPMTFKELEMYIHDDKTNLINHLRILIDLKKVKKEGLFFSLKNS